MKKKKEIWIRPSDYLRFGEVNADGLEHRWNFLEAKAQGMRAYLKCELKRQRGGKFSGNFVGFTYPGPMVAIEFPITTPIKEIREWIKKAKREYKKEIARVDKIEHELKFVTYAQIKAPYMSKSKQKEILERRNEWMIEKYKQLIKQMPEFDVYDVIREELPTKRLEFGQWGKKRDPYNLTLDTIKRIVHSRKI